MPIYFIILKMFATISVLLAIWFYTIMVSMYHTRGNTTRPAVPEVPNKKVTYGTAIEKTLNFFLSFADSLDGDIKNLLEAHMTFANNNEPSEETLMKLREIIDALGNIKQPIDPIFKKKLALMIKKLNGLHDKLEEFLRERKCKRTAK